MSFNILNNSINLQEGQNSVIVRERTFTSGRSGNGYFVEKRIRTYWEN